MWLVRELARLLLRIVLAAGIALALAAVLAAITGLPFTSSARYFCIALGCLLLAMAGIGRGGNVERYMDMSVTKRAWGRMPGFDALKPHPEDRTLTPGAVFFASGLVVIAIGAVI